MKKRNVPFCIFMLISLTTLLLADAMFEEHVIIENTNGACAIAAADFNLDGHQDMVYTCNPLGHIKWLENDGSLNFTPHMVIEGFLGAKAIDVGDVNQNGYPDFAATANTGNQISWFQNNEDGTFTEHVVSTTWIDPGWVLLCDPTSREFIDINSDGEPDILATACQAGRIGWFENDGNQNFTEHIIKDNWTVVSGAVSCDLDNDGDTDILAAAQAGGIVWFENVGDDDIFVEHLLFNAWDKANWIVAGDINDDGHMDFAATSCGTSDAVGWFENDGNQNFTLHLLRDNYNGARCPVISDIDEDGDLDIFSIAWQTGIANFFENDGNANFTDHTICTVGIDLLKFFVTDLDSDNDLDLIGCTAVYQPHHIRWWESLDEFLYADFSVDIDSGHLPMEVNFTDDSYSKPNTNTWLWDFDNDGTIDSMEPNPTFTYEEIGNYDVKLTVSNGLNSAEILKEDFIRIFNGESAIEFDSNSSNLNVPAAPNLNLSGPFTLEAWVNPFDYGNNPAFGNGMIFNKEYISIYLNNAFPLHNEHSLIVKMTHAGGYESCKATPVNSIELNTEKHVAITYDGVNDLHVYLNGIDQVLTEYTPPIALVGDNSNIDLKIGNNGSLSSGFAGVIDEVRIWNAVRSENEISEFMNQYANSSNPNLLGYWQFNEGYGNDVLDLTSNLNNGIIYNCRWYMGAQVLLTGIEPEMIPNVTGIYLTNYPNPFNPSTAISFDVNTETAEKSELIIYNLKGQKIIEFPVILSGVEGSVTWNGTDQTGKSVSSGIYFARLKVGNRTVSRKMLLMK